VVNTKTKAGSLQDVIEILGMKHEVNQVEDAMSQIISDKKNYRKEYQLPKNLPDWAIKQIVEFWKQRNIEV